MLAAGSGSRFDGTKALARLGGRPLLVHVLDAAREGGVDRCVVVVGHDHLAVADVVADRDDVEVVVNHDHARGQSTSVRAGIDAVARDDDARVAVMLLADQPGIDPQAIRQVVRALEDGADAARAQYADGAGHPVAFPRQTWPRLLDDLAGDQGARQLMDHLDVAHVLVSGSMPPDVDRPEDLARLEAEHRDVPEDH